MSTHELFSKKMSVSLDYLIKLAIAGYTRKSEIQFAESEKKKAIFAHDAIGRYINLFGVFEREELDFVFEFLAPLDGEFKKGLALDVGANIGNHAMYFSDYFYQVNAYEPNLDVFQILKFNASQCDNIIPENIGLGSESGDFILKEVSGNMMASWIDKVSDETDRKTYNIKVETIDDKGLENLKFIKIDVEGFEIDVLKGAEKTIKAQNPIILFEQHANDFENDSSPSIQFLENLNYEICWIEGGREFSSNWFRQGLSIIKAFFLGYHHGIVFGGKIPVRTHAFLLAIPKNSQLLTKHK